MIVGTVRDEIEIVVPLELADKKGQLQQSDFVVDSGSTWFLSLSPALVRMLGLTPHGLQEGRLADGTAGNFRLVYVTVNWNGVLRRIEAQILDEP